MPQQIFSQARGAPLQLPHGGPGLRLGCVFQFKGSDTADAVADQKWKGKSRERSLRRQFRRGGIVSHHAAALRRGQFNDIGK